jgi:hypothetical protein
MTTNHLPGFCLFRPGGLMGGLRAERSPGPSTLTAAIQSTKDNNQISIANLDAIARGDDANSFVDTGGTRDRATILPHHGTHTTFHVQVRQAAEHDVRSGTTRPGRKDRRPVGRGSEGSAPDPHEVDIRGGSHPRPKIDQHRARLLVAALVIARCRFASRVGDRSYRLATIAGKGPDR